MISAATSLPNTSRQEITTATSRPAPSRSGRDDRWGFGRVLQLNSSAATSWSRTNSSGAAKRASVTARWSVQAMEARTHDEGAYGGPMKFSARLDSDKGPAP